jgi:hypothetical protein
MSWAQRFCLVGALALPVGLFGAAAFNPDSGAIVHSTVLWRSFGLMFEVAAPLLLVGAMLIALTGAIKRLRPRSD